MGYSYLLINKRKYILEGKDGNSVNLLSVGVFDKKKNIPIGITGTERVKQCCGLD